MKELTKKKTEKKQTPIIRKMLKIGSNKLVTPCLQYAYM